MLQSFIRSGLASLQSVELLHLEGSGLGELDGDLVGGELLVSVGHGLDLVLNVGSVQRVQVDGLSDTSLLGDALTTADDGGWLHNVVKDSLVHSLEGAGAGALLRWVLDLSLRVNSSVDNDDDGPAELALEVVDHLGGDLAVEVERSVGDLDEDVLALDTTVGLVLALLDGVEEDHAEVLLHLSVGLLESGKSLGGLLLELSGLHLLTKNQTKR